MRRPVLAALAAAMVASAALAQPATVQETPAASPVNKAIVDGANGSKLTPAPTPATGGPVNAAQVAAATAKGQYEADRLAYRNAVIARNIAIAHDQARYETQQNKYAEAMAAWRIQAEACKRGDKAGCETPEPDPASFY